MKKNFITKVFWKSSQALKIYAGSNRVKISKKTLIMIFFFILVGNVNTFNLVNHQVLNLKCPSIKE